MCNSFSTAYSLIFDTNALVKGNRTKIPEVILGANSVLTALGKTNTAVGRVIKKGYDTFGKNGHEKFYEIGQKNTNPIRFFMGITDCRLHKEGNWVKKYVPYVAGFAADLLAEGFMGTKTGSKVLDKVSSTISNTLCKNQKAKETVNALISGVAYQFIADTVEDKVEQLTDKVIDKFQKQEEQKVKSLTKKC